MGRPKQLLPWPPPDGPLLIAVSFDAISASCEDMIVVLGPDGDEAAAALGDRRFRRVTPDGDDMLDSVKAGLRAARKHHPDADALLHPADHPRVSSRTLTILRESRSEGDQALMPEHEGRGGHPVLIPSPHFDAILGWSGSGGLRQFWLEHRDSCRRIPVDDPWTVRDLDTPEDYTEA